MIRYDGFVLRPTDDPEQGNVAIGASVAIRVKSTLALATIYSDEAGTVELDNPLTTNDLGKYSFYAAAGDYIVDVEDGSASIQISLISTDALVEDIAAVDQKVDDFISGLAATGGAVNVNFGTINGVTNATGLTVGTAINSLIGTVEDLVSGEGDLVGVPTKDLVAKYNTITNTTVYSDFTKMPNGEPRGTADSGQAVDFIFNPTGRKPVILDGRLVVNEAQAIGTGTLADYYQVDAGSPIVSVGCEFTMPDEPDNGNANITYAAWGHIYEGGGTLIPKSWCHMSIVPNSGNTGTAKFFVCNDLGNLFVIKQQDFVNPPRDGTTIWHCRSILDAENGKVYSYLPDGSLMVCRDSDIAFMCGVLSLPVFTFLDLSSNIVMCEHYSNAPASASTFGGICNVFGTTEGDSNKQKLINGNFDLANAKQNEYLLSLIPPAPTSAINYPSTEASLVTTNSTVNFQNITFSLGPTAKALITVTAYYEFTANDTLFIRLAGGGQTPTPSRSAYIGTNGEKTLITHTIEFTGATAGQELTMSLQHFTINSGSATLKYGGTGGSSKPPVQVIALPI